METFNEDEFIKVINDFFDYLMLDSPDDYNKLFDSMSLDMLDTVELFMAIEKHYCISIPDLTCEAFETINDIKNYLIRLQTNNQQPNKHP